MPRVDRLGITVSLVTLGLLLSILVTLPSRILSFWVLGSQLSLNLTGPVQLGIIMVGLVAAGVDALVRTHPRMHDRSLAYTATFWVLPSVLVLAIQVLLRDLTWMGLKLVLVGLAGVMLIIVMGAQYLTIESGRPALSQRAVGAQCCYLHCSPSFSLSRSIPRGCAVILSATSVLLISGMLALDLFRIPPNKAWRTWLYAGLVALTMGQLTWALNYARIDARVGGAFLLLVFYVLSGIIQQYLWRRLTGRMLLEYAFVGLIGMALCERSRPLDARLIRKKVQGARLL